MNHDHPTLRFSSNPDRAKIITYLIYLEFLFHYKHQYMKYGGEYLSTWSILEERKASHDRSIVWSINHLHHILSFSGEEKERIECKMHFEYREYVCIYTRNFSWLILVNFITVMVCKWISIWWTQWLLHATDISNKNNSYATHSDAIIE